MSRCSVPGCHRRGRLVPLPLIGRSAWLCDIHRGARFLAVMRELVAHG